MKCTNPSCRNYGRELAPGAKFCGVCGQIVKEAPAAPPPASKASGTGIGSAIGSIGREMLAANRMPQGIALGVGEQIVKEYKIGRYTFRQGSIEVIVTNKRVIRYEESSMFGMKNNQMDDVHIDAVHGSYTRMRRSISVLGMIVALALLCVGCFFLFGQSAFGFGFRGEKSPLEIIGGLFLVSCAVAIVVASLKPTLEFALMGALGNDALGTEVNKRGRIVRRDGNSVIFQFKPTHEATVMLKEIGALIYDLKTLGDKVISKWN